MPQNRGQLKSGSDLWWLSWVLVILFRRFFTKFQYLRVANIQALEFWILHPHCIRRQNSTSKTYSPVQMEIEETLLMPWLCCRKVKYLQTPPNMFEQVWLWRRPTFPTQNLTILTYFGSSVLRNISCMVVLSSAVGAIFSNDVELKATLLPLFTTTGDNKSYDQTGHITAQASCPGLPRTL